MIKIEDGKLVVDEPLEHGHPSASGKTIVVFSTGGFVKLEGGYSANITVIKPRS